jgi:hypothetical protein
MDVCSLSLYGSPLCTAPSLRGLVSRANLLVVEDKRNCSGPSSPYRSGHISAWTVKKAFCIRPRGRLLDYMWAHCIRHRVHKAHTS